MVICPNKSEKVKTVVILYIGAFLHIMDRGPGGDKLCVHVPMCALKNEQAVRERIETLTLSGQWTLRR